MKKITMLFFSLMLVIFSAINVIALDDYKSIVKVGNVEVPVYNLETTWGKMEFIYNEQINYLWNSNTHTYELSESSFKWIGVDNYIDINNKSQMPVDVELDYNSINDKVLGKFDYSKKTINPNEKSRFTLTLDGELSNRETEYVKVGLISLSIK